MSIQEQDSAISIRSIDNDDFLGAKDCDESMCVSKGGAYLFNKSFTCYGDEFSFPRMCADGFLPVVVQDEPNFIDTSFGVQVNVSYFTCCPPSYSAVSSNTNTDINVVTRECSDPISTVATNVNVGINNDNILSGVCDDQKYPRKMKTSLSTDFKGSSTTSSMTNSILCCDSLLPSDKEQINFLDDSECVPYRNEYYEFIPALNFFTGNLVVISCDFSEGSFTVPRSLEGYDHTDFVSAGLFQCCRTGTPLEPYVQDNKFKMTVYIPLTIWLIAAIVSAIVIIALLIPLFRHDQKKTFGIRRRRSHTVTPSYSNYNLYVVYLAFFDLIYSLFEIGLFLSMIHQKFNPNFHHVISIVTGIIYAPILFSSEDRFIAHFLDNMNMWINAVIFYELFLLLKQSRRARRISQPTTTRINKQVGFVFFISMIYIGLTYILRHLSIKAGLAGEFAKVEKISAACYVLFWLSPMVPLAFICGISIRIMLGGYLPSSNKQSSSLDDALRQLFFFFLRIILIYLVIWIPDRIMVHYIIARSMSSLYMVVMSLTAAQPIFSTLMVLTKYDARKYIVDLLTLSYCRSAGGTNTSGAISRMQGSDPTNSDPNHSAFNIVRVEEEHGTGKVNVCNIHTRATMTGQVRVPDGSSTNDKHDSVSLTVIEGNHHSQGPRMPSRRQASDEGREGDAKSSIDEDASSLQFSIFGSVDFDALNNDDNDITADIGTAGLDLTTEEGQAGETNTERCEELQL